MAQVGPDRLVVIAARIKNPRDRAMFWVNRRSIAMIAFYARRSDHASEPAWSTSARRRPAGGCEGATSCPNQVSASTFSLIAL
jgi:hypothetical protein